MKISPRIFRIVTLLAALGLAGCDTYQQYSHPVFPDAPTDKAVVYFYRDDSSDGEKYDFIQLNKQNVADLVPRSYTFIFCNPGDSSFRVVGNTSALYPFPIEAGHTYYFHVNLKPIWGGFMGYRVSLMPVDREEALPALKDLACISLHKPDPNLLNATAPSPATTTNAASFTDTPASFGSASGPFADYDRKIVKSIQTHWYQLIERSQLYKSGGVVTISFQLLADGDVTNVRATSTNNNAQILVNTCEQAIKDSAPFDPLPDNLHKLLGDQPRDATFTFNY